MKPTKILIEALRRAADTIEELPVQRWHSDDDAYSHMHSDSCNCGWLARCLGLPRNKLRRLSYYSDNANKYFREQELQCSVLDRPVREVFDFLVAAGLERWDFHAIEFLNDDTVLARAGIVSKHYADPQHVARYFRAQADLLEEQLVAPTPPALVLNAAWPTVAMQVKPVEVGV